MAERGRGLVRGLTRNVLILGAVSLLTDASSEMIIPLYPIFVTQVLGAGPLVFGLIDGAADTASSFLKVVSGYASDRMGRRKGWVIGGYGLSTLSKGLFALATTWPAFLGLRILERIGKGLRTAPRDAIIAGSADEAYRARAFGFHRAMDTAGAVIGPLLAMGALWWLAGSGIDLASQIRSLFLIAVIPALLGVALLFLVAEQASGRRKDLRPAMAFRKLPPTLRWFVLAASIFAVADVGHGFLLLRVTQLGFSPSVLLALYVGYNVVYAALAYPIGSIADRYGKMRVVAAGYGVYGLVAAGFMAFTSLSALAGLFVAFGLSQAMVDATQRAAVADLAPESVRGTALGTLHTSVGVVELPAGVIIGALWTLAPEAAFAAAAAGCALALGLLALARRRRRV